MEGEKGKYCNYILISKENLKIIRNMQISKENRCNGLKAFTVYKKFKSDRIWYNNLQIVIK